MVYRCLNRLDCDANPCARAAIHAGGIRSGLFEMCRNQVHIESSWYAFCILMAVQPRLCWQNCNVEEILNLSPVAIHSAKPIRVPPLRRTIHVF
jgi:hypothetical protein